MDFLTDCEILYDPEPMNQTTCFSKKELLLAHKRIRPHIHRTPVLTSGSINQLVGGELLFKCENFQRVGAFKMRGALNAALKLSKRQLQKGLCTHSSGNHGQAIAKVAQILEVPAYIVMPENAPQVKVEAVKAYGGSIAFCSPNLLAREKGVESLIQKYQSLFIPPYDHPDIINGQATAAIELFEEHSDLDFLICPIGGGGLMAGSILATQHFSPNTCIIGAEPSGADDAYQSWKSQRLVPQRNPKTIADGLLTSLGKLNFSIIKKGVQDIITVDDDEIMSALNLIFERMKILVEPSAAVPLAALIKNKKQFTNKKIGIILSGGNIDLNSFFSLKPRD